jgi:hypothetical protein
MFQVKRGLREIVLLFAVVDWDLVAFLGLNGKKLQGSYFIGFLFLRNAGRSSEPQRPPCVLANTPLKLGS